MGFNSAFLRVKIVKNPGKGRLNNLNDPSRPQCVKKKTRTATFVSRTESKTQSTNRWSKVRVIPQGGVILKCKIKGKCHPMTGHKGPKGR